MGKDERLHIRLDPAARKKLLRACELTGLDEPSALRACVQAFIEHVEEHGGIWLPLAIVPKAEASKAAAPPSLGATSPGVPSPTDSTRFSVNEAPRPGPHPRSTRGIKNVARPKT